MDKNVHDKKWFVYLNDHHEGPFTVAEIVEKQNKGVVMPATSYVWCEGMKDWMLMGEVPEFKPPTVPVPPKPTLTPPPAQITRETPSAFLEPSAVMEVQTLSRIDLPAPKPLESVEPPLEMQQSVGATIEPPSTDFPPEHKTLTDLHEPKLTWMQRHRRLVRTAAALLILGSLGFAGYFAYPHLDRIPGIADWISPIKPHPQLAEEDLARLRDHAKMPFDKVGGKIALALGKDRIKPMVFIGTNLPDGTKLIVRADGLKGTLLHQTQAQVMVPVTVQRHYAEALVVQDGGRPVPQGDYMFYVYESRQDQPAELVDVLQKAPASPMTVPNLVPNPKWVETRAAFLGGSKDPIYIERLKKYHDDLRARAKNELVEIGQLYQTLLNQMRESTQTFEKMKKLKPARVSKPWAAFHTRWSGLVDSMLTEFKQWTQERLKAERFYFPLFMLAKDTGERLQAVQKAQNARMTGKVVPDAELEAQRAQLQSHLNLLEQQIKKAQSLLESPDGVPEIPEAPVNNP